MNAYRIVLIALLAVATATGAPQSSPRVSLASIQGVVTNVQTKLPVSGAVVELTYIERGKVLSHSVVTGKDGKFEFRNLRPANDYELTASDDYEYVPVAYGQYRSSDPWTPIALAAGQIMKDVQLAMTPVGSISGKVTDGAGKPLSRADVYILQASYSEGRRDLQRVAVTQTLSSGDYFVSGLANGQYYVRVNPANLPEFRSLFESPSAWDQSRLIHGKEGEPDGFPTSYYPGVMDLAAAQPVDLLNGGKATANIVAPKVKTRRVSGTVLAIANGKPTPEPIAGASVLLVQRTAGPVSSFTRKVTSGLDGQFDFRGVLPGAYFLVASVSVEKSSLTARLPVDVRDGDLQKLSITAVRGFDIQGRIHFAEWPGAAPPDYSQFAVNFVPDASAPVDRTFPGFLFTASLLTVAPSADGQFVVRNVPTGDYRILLSLNRQIPAKTIIPLDIQTTYMTAGRLGNTDILDGGIHIDGKPAGAIEIVLATNSGSIFGRVLDRNREAAPPARMVLAPDNARRKRFDLFSVVAVSPTGRFSLDGIPPGDYKIFAWSHVEDGAWFDPQFMRVYEDRGVPIHIEESGSHPIEIPIIY